MDGSIPVLGLYIDDSLSNEVPKWTDETIGYYLERFSFKNIKSSHCIEGEPYGGASKLHVHVCESYSDSVSDKNVAVLGSINPWIEAILVNAGAKTVTTVEYNVPECNHPIIKTISYDEFCNSHTKYDSVFSFSSIEHSGLGRYGDPLNPNGDIETIKHIKSSLVAGGMLFLGIPVGKDSLVWNAHRIYGPKRLNVLFGGFDEIEWIGAHKKDIFYTGIVPYGHAAIQPIIVLMKKD